MAVAEALFACLQGWMVLALKGQTRLAGWVPTERDVSGTVGWSWRMEVLKVRNSRTGGGSLVLRRTGRVSTRSEDHSRQTGTWSREPGVSETETSADGTLIKTGQEAEPESQLLAEVERGR